MATYKFPGIYPTIRDLSGIVADNTSTTCAYVGEAEYGPVFTPTLVTTTQEFINKFGMISSKYGYAGYSLAVAAETISAHQFVRVVPANAKWGAVKVLSKTSSAIQPVSDGYTYDQVTAAQNSNATTGDSGLFVIDNGDETVTKDMDSAFIVLANDPNERKFYVSVADSTINENKGYAISALTYENESDTQKSYITMVLPLDIALNEEKQLALEAGESIVVSKVSDEKLNGIFTILTINTDEEAKTATLVYEVEDIISDTPTFEKARVARYPADNETTFSLTIYEKVGTVYQALETYEYCTLYPAQDNYGNSTFIEDLVNGSSKYVQVFANVNITNDEIVIPKFVEYLPLAGNTSGTWDTTTNEKYTALNNAWELFRDRAQIDVSILMNSGYVTESNVSYQAKMLEIAEARRDCFCLFDVPMNRTEYEDAIDWRKNIQGFNSYRGAVCSPWVKTYDAIQGRANFIMCPSAYMAKVMGAYEPWMAPAGLNRGILTASTVSPTGLTQYYNATQGGNLYADNQINCYIKNPGAGYVIWGQRTLQAKPSALDRINVARTVIYIETVLRDAARWHLFENNTPYERMQITLQFSAFLDTVLTADGISKYSVICDESNNTPQVIANNQMVIDVYLWPVYCAEIIRLQTTVMAEGAEVTVTTG